MKDSRVQLMVTIFLLSLGSGCALTNQCQSRPAETNAPATPGDNGFRIKIGGTPEKYVPGDVYTVSIQGWRSQYSIQKKFIRFWLQVVPSATPSRWYGHTSVGTFRLYADGLSRHSSQCSNTVVETSSIPKSEVQVMWSAPPAGSGCVTFKATVVEQKDLWFTEEGELSKELCEDIQENEDVQPTVIDDCCACDEAKYEVTFEGLWSRHTHPKDFPKNEWLTHFSDVIGASHSADYRVWKYGGYASDGLRQVAEWGSTRALESELKSQSKNIRTIIKARGLWYPNVNGKTFAVFRVDNHHHLMSLVSMLGPSPDWIVGVSALELCLKNCSWVPEKSLNLYPWDAGTDSGVTYSGPKKPSIPREKIRRITNSYPNDPKNPFYDPNGMPMKPLARLTITRQRVYEKSCSETDPLESISDSYSYSEDLDSMRPECAVTDFSEWTPCSVTCGKGIRQRDRSYLMPAKARMLGCNRQLTEREMCQADVTFCDEDEFSPVLAPFRDPKLCMTSEWSSWSPCSVTCGKGFTMRTRSYFDHMGRKKCDKELIEKKSCMAEIPECDHREQEENIYPACAVTQWTDWSPCTKTCGSGIRVRYRSHLTPIADDLQCNVTLMEKHVCQNRDCSISKEEAYVKPRKEDCSSFKNMNLSYHERTQYELWCRLGNEESDASLNSKEDVCRQAKEVGPCRGYFIRYYFDTDKNMCIQFVYGGCKGNRNNFESYDECTRTCEFVLLKSPVHEHAEFPTLNIPPADPPIDCMVTDWSDWSKCNVTCGKGMKEKRRMIKQHPLNGGKPCPTKLVRYRKCKGRDCPPPNHGLQILDSVWKPDIEEAEEMEDHRPLPRSYLNEMYHVQRQRELEDQREFQMLQINDTNVDCSMGEWGPWSPCTHSCGEDALQQRARSVIVKAKGHGTPCGPRWERRICKLPPCPPRNDEWYYSHRPWDYWNRV